MSATHYAKSGDLRIAYQTVGTGPMDLVFVPGILSHVEFFQELPGFARLIERLSSFARVVIFDKRGTGLSDRIPDAPIYELRMDDIRAVMDAVGIERAALFGISEGAALAALFAASHPERAQALVGYGTFARLTPAPDYPVAIDLEALETLMFNLIVPGVPPSERWDRALDLWGTGVSLIMFSPSRAADPEARALWGKVERFSSSPGDFRALYDITREIDVRCALPNVQVPTLVLRPEGDLFPLELSSFFASEIPGARFVELKGVDHYPWFGDVSELAAEVEEFLTGVRPPPDAERALATVLFTDIVDSTKRATEIGDRRWRELLEQHDRLVRKQLQQFRGHEVDTAGDSFLATFDGPARAIRCAAAIRDAVAGIGLRVRAGLHAGECEVSGDRVTGVAVHLGARVVAEAEPGDILVSSTVKDLVAGSGLEFADRGARVLKGIPGEWRLFAAAV